MGASCGVPLSLDVNDHIFDPPPRYSGFEAHLRQVVVYHADGATRSKENTDAVLDSNTKAQDAHTLGRPMIHLDSSGARRASYHDLDSVSDQITTSVSAGLNAVWGKLDPSKAKTRSALMIYLHGRDTDLNVMAPQLQKLRDKLYLAVLAPEYDGYGPTRMLKKPSVNGMIQAAEHAMKVATVDYGYQPEQIVVYGRSLGCVAATGLLNHLSNECEGSNDKVRLGGVILHSPFTNIGQAAAEAYNCGVSGGLISACALPQVMSAGELQSWDCEAPLRNERISEVPLMILHGMNDNVISVKHARTLFNSAATKHKHMSIPADVGHSDFDLDGDVVFHLNSFFQKYLRSSLSTTVDHTERANVAAVK